MVRNCEAEFTDNRGAVVFGDFNGDARQDVLALPVIVSDIGFGPKGTQGAVLVFMATARANSPLLPIPRSTAKRSCWQRKTSTPTA